MNTEGRRYVSLVDARRALQALYRGDPENNVGRTLLRIFEDELPPVNSHGRWRPSKLFVILVGAVLTTACVFVYFSFTR